MRIWTVILIGIATLLTACEVPQEATTHAKPASRVYSIAASDKAKIEFRMLDAINTLRNATGVGPLALNSRLNAAAATHSRDMSLQNRPWHFGSDGSSPLDRIARVGYTGTFLGENISETYETELETLSTWMFRQDTKEVILDSRANELGFAWYQESNGKLWWTLVTGMKAESPQPSTQDTAQKLDQTVK